MRLCTACDLALSLTSPEGAAGDHPFRPRHRLYDTDQQGRRRLPDRHHHRVLRLLHLRHRRRAGVPEAVLPRSQPIPRDRARVRHLRRRVRRPPPRRRRLRPLRRPARPQEDARPLTDDHGRLDRADRRPAHLRHGRGARTGAAGAAAARPGHRRRRRMGRRGADGGRTRPAAAPRLLRQLAPGRRPARDAAGHRSVLPRLAAARRRLPHLGLAAAVPGQRDPHHRRTDHPPADHREPRVPGGAPAQGRGAPAPSWRCCAITRVPCSSWRAPS